MLAKFDWPSTVALIVLCLCLSASAEETGAEDEIHLERQDACAFYCFLLPKQKDSSESIKKNIDALRDMNCTHLVYGYASIDHHYRVHAPNQNDMLLDAYWGNYRLLHELHSRTPPMKLLLGVREDLGVHFIDSSSTRKNVTKNVVLHAEHNYFDGFFLNLRDTQLNSFYFEQFVKDLRLEIEDRVHRHGKTHKTVVLALRAQDAFHTSRRVRAYVDKFDAFYLKGDESLSAQSDVTTVVSLDPIYMDENTPFEDVISEMANTLVKNGIPEEKLIIGLNTVARGYSLASRNDTSHGSFAYEYAHLNNSQSKDGRFAYQEICKLPGAENVEYWDKSVTTSFVDDQDNLFSFNMPNHESMERKVTYIMNHGFGGIGISHVEADDPEDDCGNGPYPLYKFVSERLKCKKHAHEHGGTTECKRMCVYRPERGQISFQNFKAEWCSHYVISSIGFNSNGTIDASQLVKDAISNYNSWSAPQKPYLVLSIGAEQGTDDWQRVLDDESKRKTLINGIWHLYKDNNADGVSIDFVKEAIASSPQEKDAMTNFEVFLKELKNAKPIRKAAVFLTVTSESTFLNYYNIPHINSTVDYVVLEGYRFHSPSDEFTGHHSPLFGNSSFTGDKSIKSIEGLADAWSKGGVPRNRLILGFSAAGVVMNVIRDEESPALRSADVHDTKFIGLKLDKSDVQTEEHSTGPGLISQTELCEELQKGKAIHRFIHELAVPVARKDNSYYSYDDSRSIQTKAIWASLNHFAGVSLHAIEFDNPESRCPSKEPFNLLQKIVETQACEACANPMKSPEKFIIDSDSCQPKPFRIICNYQLPKVDVIDNSALSSELIPFDRCDEVVIEEIILTHGGVLTFHGEQEHANLNKVFDLIHRRPDFKKQLYLILRCRMTPDEFKNQLEGKLITAEKIAGQLSGFSSFAGIELRCDQAMNNETKPLFKEFVNNLKTIYESRKDQQNLPCVETVSIRIPIWNKNLTEKYDVEQLNGVHQVVLETFEHEAKNARLVSPLYGLDKSDETHSIDFAISNWIETGIRREKIIMQLPTYGLVQTFTNSNAHHRFNDTVEEHFSLISQPALCFLFNQTGPNSYQQHILYDMVNAYATSNNKIISYETTETVTYKVKFAIRERLGGVGLLNLNQEDYHGICNTREFGLLNAVHASICPAM
ncbi:Chitinase-like protein C25A8.4 [Aphelenchoides bicaudatus]|nr:Chitinase-like protein C25A8.4 [Aphelenchoides bicaudatus]